MRGGQPDMQRKQAGLHAKAEEREPEQRRQIRLLAHRPEIPTARARRERGEERKQADRARVRRGQIKPACGANVAAGSSSVTENSRKP